MTDPQASAGEASAGDVQRLREQIATLTKVVTDLVTPAQAHILKLQMIILGDPTEPDKLGLLYRVRDLEADAKTFRFWLNLLIAGVATLIGGILTGLVTGTLRIVPSSGP